MTTPKKIIFIAVYILILVILDLG